MTATVLALLAVLSVWPRTTYRVSEEKIEFWNRNASHALLLYASKDSIKTSIGINAKDVGAFFSPESQYGTCEGFIGTFSIPSASYAGVILSSVDCEHVGPGVRKIKEIGLIKIPGHGGNDADDRATAHDASIRLMHDAFSRHSFYYSTNLSLFDVTRSTQSNALRAGLLSSSDASSIEACDDRFFWNYELCKDIIASGKGEYVTPISNIWTDTVPLRMGERDYNFTIVSRRSRFRQGPRFLSRGIDKQGHVANFVETEQILSSSQGETFSFVQARGSIPLFWSQLPKKWRLKAQVKLNSSVGSELSMKSTFAHFEELYHKYCLQNETDDSVGIAVVNLIDKRGIQLELGCSMFQMLGSLSDGENHPDEVVPELCRDELCVRDYRLPRRTANTESEPKTQNGVINVKYIWHDYHYNSDINGARNANVLYEPLRRYFRRNRRSLLPTAALHNDKHIPNPIRTRKFGNFFHRESTGKVNSLQHGVIRTNCIDCLDRTNVVQSLFSKWSLIYQLNTHNPNGFPKTKLFADTVPNDALIGVENMKKFRHIWAEHGDAISMLYAGTKALKRDVTQFGRRTGSGAIQDGVTYWKRYFMSHLRDPSRQKGIDIILGIDKKS